MISRLRLAMRALRRNPVPTAVIALTLAVAIGVSTIIASTVDSVWHAVPVANTDRLIFVSSTDPRPNEARAGMAGDVAITGTSIPDFVDWTARSSTVDDLAAFQYATVTLTGLAAPERASVVRATANLPAQWQIPMAIGRSFRPDDGRIGAARVALLTDRYWRERFAARPDIIGTSVFLDGVPHTLVGVVSASAGRGIFVDTDMWLPQELDAARASRDARTLFVSARLKPGATIEQAERDFTAIAEQLKNEYPTTNAQTGIVVRPLVELLGGGIRFLLSLLALLATLVVAMACTNVSNVVLAQVSARRRELSLRTVLGAGRWDHVKQIHGRRFRPVSCGRSHRADPRRMGTERTQVAGRSTSPCAHRCVDQRTHRRHWRDHVVCHSFRVLSAAGTPRMAARCERPASRRARHPLTGSPHANRARRAASCPGGRRARPGCSARTYGVDIREATFGLDPTQVLTLKMDVSPARYPMPDNVTRFYTALLDRIEALPGVTSAGAINRLPVGDRDLSVRVRVDGAPPVATEALPSLMLASVSGNYLRTMRIPVLRGRALEAADFSGGQPVALVSEDAARQLWPRGDVLGSRATLTLAGEPDQRVLIVGVVANLRSADVFRRSLAQVYVPWTLRPDRAMAIAIRTEPADPLSIASAVRGAAASLEPNEPIFAVSSMAQVIFNDTASQHILTSLIIAVGFLALCLAAAGIYGVVSYVVVQRTREIGVRVALGARPSAVRRMVVAQGAWPVIGGWVLGLPLALPIAFAMARAFAFITASDPLNYIAVLSSIALVAVASCYLPARRASRVDPVIALRAE
jgi:ABC-type antimicrobial peptide transport system permease subunit